jgi:hypothetical protein
MALLNIGSALQPSASTAREMVVDLTPEPAKAKVVREGYQVPAVALDEKKSSFFLDNLKQITPKQEPRVVSQSVAAGTKILPGTAIDLVLAPSSSIPFDIFDTPHKSLVGKNLPVLDPVLDNATIRQTLLKYSNPADVAPADKTLLTNAFATVGVSVDDANADTGFGAAFNSARGALAFR